jgi:hypothetical protein
MARSDWDFTITVEAVRKTPKGTIMESVRHTTALIRIPHNYTQKEGEEYLTVKAGSAALSMIDQLRAREAHSR